MAFADITFSIFELFVDCAGAAPTSEKGKAPIRNRREGVICVTHVRAKNHKKATERLKFFLDCCYSVSRREQAVGQYYKWNFRFSRSAVRRNYSV
jgi:hypothetical protein